MPRYRCHKEVWALKIKEINPTIVPSEERPGMRTITPGHTIQMVKVQTVLVPKDDSFAPFEVSDEYMQKHNPKIGGYYVVYKDGYASFSPEEAFEDGYTRI